MAYIKLIQSGTLVETWEFERSPPERRVSKKPRVRRVFRTERRADNIVRCRDSFRRLVRANLSPVEPPALLTMTIRDVGPVADAYGQYTVFGRDLRRRFGDGLKWVAVPEFQKRGAVHFHVLIWGLPPLLPCKISRKFYYDKTGKKHRKHTCPPGRSCERATRILGGLWPWGFLDIVETDGSPKLSTYLAKYMSKAMHDQRLLGKRAYSASRNVLRPVLLNTPLSVATARGVLGLGGVDNALSKIREYDTLFLGRCIYSSYEQSL